MTYSQMCLDAVLEIGECTVSRVANKLRHFVSAAACAAEGRSYRQRNLRRGRCYWRITLIETGLREIVGATLRKLVANGKLRRVGKGVYAPPSPKIYKAS